MSPAMQTGACTKGWAVTHPGCPGFLETNWRGRGRGRRMNLKTVTNLVYALVIGRLTLHIIQVAGSRNLSYFTFQWKRKILITFWKNPKSLKEASQTKHVIGWKNMLLVSKYRSDSFVRHWKESVLHMFNTGLISSKSIWQAGDK